VIITSYARVEVARMFSVSGSVGRISGLSVGVTRLRSNVDVTVMKRVFLTVPTCEQVNNSISERSFNKEQAMCEKRYKILPACYCFKLKQFN